MQHVRQVFQLLREHKLEVKEKKSFFGHQSVQYLGFTIDQQGIRPDVSHIKALAQWHVPTLETRLESLMGGINYYKMCVSHFSQWARPLHQLENKEKNE